MIHPKNKVKQIWDFWIVFLLIYTAILVPYKVCFVDKTSDPEFIWDLFVDASFFTDIALTFYTAIETKEGFITDKKVIAKTYVKGWFFLDLFTSIPFQILEKIGSSSDSNLGDSKALRLARIPRLYRLLRIFRLFKLMKVFKGSNRFQKVGVLARIGKSFKAMFKIIFMIIYITHLMACFFFF